MLFFGAGCLAIHSRDSDFFYIMYLEDYLRSLGSWITTLLHGVR
jgi:hypothetical protein